VDDAQLVALLPQLPQLQVGCVVWLGGMFAVGDLPLVAASQ
jgi:hypothetical protein